VKKTIIAAFASLMLAGIISAASSATTNATTGMIVIVGDGSAPIPLAAPVSDASDGASHTK